MNSTKSLSISSTSDTTSPSTYSSELTSTSAAQASSSSGADSQAVVARVGQFGENLTNLPKSAKVPGVYFPNAGAVQELVGLYSNSSVVAMFGPAHYYHSGIDLVGSNLTDFYIHLALDYNYSQATISNLTSMEVAPYVINASFDLVLAGSQLGNGYTGGIFGIGQGAFNFTIHDQQQWVNQGNGKRLIQRESWDWTKFCTEHSRSQNGAEESFGYGGPSVCSP